MTTGPTIDGQLVQWGERLFYPRNRIVKSLPIPRLDVMLRRKAAVIRRRIEAVAVRRAPQVMVKVKGGGPGMRAIVDHFQYVSREGSLVMEDDRGVRSRGTEALRDLADQWRYGGSLIEEVSHRHEAVYVTLSMPHGTDPRLVLQAAREFARDELAGSRYVMVLHEHQAHPHVHLTVRAQSMSGERLQTWTERHRWRETFAEKLRGLGVDAEATWQVWRGENRTSAPIWRAKAPEQGSVRETRSETKSGERYYNNRAQAMVCWAHIARALLASPDPDDRRLAQRVASFLVSAPFIKETLGRQLKDAEVTRERDYASPQPGWPQKQREWTISR